MDWHALVSVGNVANAVWHAPKVARDRPGPLLAMVALVSKELLAHFFKELLIWPWCVGQPASPGLTILQNLAKQVPGGFWAYFFTFLVQDLSQQVRNGRRIHGDRFSGRTVDSGPISDHFWCFWPDLKIRSGPKVTNASMMTLISPIDIM